ETAREPRHLEMAFDDAITQRRIGEVGRLAQHAAGDAGKLQPDLIHPVHQAFGVVGEIDLVGLGRAAALVDIAVGPNFVGSRLLVAPAGRALLAAERAAEHLDIAVADLARLAEALEQMAGPAARRPGGVTD